MGGVKGSRSMLFLLALFFDHQATAEKVKFE